MKSILGYTVTLALVFVLAGCLSSQHKEPVIVEVKASVRDAEEGVIPKDASTTEVKASSTPRSLELDIKSNPEFKDYPVAEVFSGDVPQLKFNTESRKYRTRLKQAANGKPNFAGHYIIAMWGCGTDCLMGGLVNAKTGDASLIPFTICCVFETGTDLEKIDFRLNSNLIILNGLLNESESSGRQHFYEFSNGKFLAISDRSSGKESDDSLTAKEAGTAMKMVSIEDGCFLMGGPSKETERDRDDRQAKVCVNNFAIGTYEVTQQQWMEIMGSNPANFEGNQRPVEQVSLYDAQTFIKRLNYKTDRHYRLPTSAEWEYAARGGTTTEYYTGDCISVDQANYNGDNRYAGCETKTGLSRGKTLPVGSFKPNAYGLHDMAGNVWEWTCSEDFEQFENFCLGGIKDWDKLIIQGGAWGYSSYSARSAHRSWRNPEHARDDLGFRLAEGS